MSFSSFIAKSLQPPSPYPSPACGPNPSAGRPSRGEGEVGNDLENDISIDSCHHIIQDDSTSSFQSFLQLADRKWFENVEKAKENKTDDDEESCLRNTEHRD